MLTAVMEHFALVKALPPAGYDKTAPQKQLFKDSKAAIQSGKLVALAGSMGCGKTTTLRRLLEVLGQEGKSLVSQSLAVDKDRATLSTLMAALFDD